MRRRSIVTSFFEKQIATDIPDRVSLVRQLGRQVNFAGNRFSAKAQELQKLLNAHGAFLKVDGKAGRNTSDAYFRVTGEFLPNDPGA